MVTSSGTITSTSSLPGFVGVLPEDVHDEVDESETELEDVHDKSVSFTHTARLTGRTTTRHIGHRTLRSGSDLRGRGQKGPLRLQCRPLPDQVGVHEEEATEDRTVRSGERVKDVSETTSRSRPSSEV